MQTITRTFPATTPWTHDTAIGVVGSGDLEVLVTRPSTPDTATVHVRTSVDGFDTVWNAVLDRFFTRQSLAGDYEINDFGATPGMVTLRLSQAFEAGTQDTTEPTIGAIEQPATARPSFVELRARDRVRALLDEGTFREILGPFEKVESAQLEPQGIVPQADDGAVIGRGTIDGTDTAVVALEGKFQGGGIGEVSGAKIAAVLEKAAREAEQGHRVPVVILLETGGIRLQEANLGLLAIAEIHAGIVALKNLGVPVVGVVAGMVGCFGGMGIAAGLTSTLIMTRAGRLSLNGPEVIETEAGVAELNASDKGLLWSMLGGEQRVATHRAEVLVDDDPAAVRHAVAQAVATEADPKPARDRAGDVDTLRAELDQIDPTSRPTPADIRTLTTRSAQ